MMTYNNNSSVR